MKTKSFIAGAIAGFLISLSVPALAAQIEAAINSVNILVKGDQVAAIGDNYTLANGTEVPFSILYKGTTYLPIRKLSELLNIAIDWDAATSTVIVGNSGGTAPQPAVAATPTKAPSPTPSPTPEAETPPETDSESELLAVIKEKLDALPKIETAMETFARDNYLLNRTSDRIREDLSFVRIETDIDTWSDDAKNIDYESYGSTTLVSTLQTSLEEIQDELLALKGDYPQLLSEHELEVILAKIDDLKALEDKLNAELADFMETDEEGEEE